MEIRFFFHFRDLQRKPNVILALLFHFRTEKDLLFTVFDFTKVDVDASKSYQVFIIHVYHWTEEVGFVSTPYFYFSSQAGTKNDVDFVRAALGSFIDEMLNIFTPSEFVIWSDNARAHFKQRYTMQFIGKIRNDLQVPVTWNFSAEYHGSGACDADAATMKKNVRKQQRERGAYITQPKELMKIVHNTSNYVARMVEVPKKAREAAALPGISSYYKFQWSPDGKTLFGSVFSADSEPAKTWKL